MNLYKAGRRHFTFQVHKGDRQACAKWHELWPQRRKKTIYSVHDVHGANIYRHWPRIDIVLSTYWSIGEGSGRSFRFSLWGREHALRLKRRHMISNCACHWPVLIPGLFLLPFHRSTHLEQSRDARHSKELRILQRERQGAMRSVQCKVKPKLTLSNCKAVIGKGTTHTGSRSQDCCQPNPRAMQHVLTKDPRTGLKNTAKKLYPWSCFLR
jgi:hypothetical protein